MGADIKRFVSPALFGVVVLCFFMPFLLVQCQGQTVATVSGVDMVTGTSVSAGGYGSAQVVRPVIWAILGLGMAVAGFVLGFTRIDKTQMLSIVAAGVGFVCLAIIGMFGPSVVARESSGVVSASWGSGLSLGLLFFIAAGGYNLYLAARPSPPEGQSTGIKLKMPAFGGGGPPPPNAFCSECGRPLPPGSQFCTECGASVRQSVRRPAPAGFESGGQAQPASYPTPAPVASPDSPAPARQAPATVFAPAPTGEVLWEAVLQDGTRYGLRQGTVRIGRQSGNDIMLNDPSVSREHARLEVLADGIALTDLNSTSGTTINGVRQTNATIVDGDKVSFGVQVLSFERAH